MNKLFQNTQLGNMKLKNHIVMAPMTRSRAIGNVPNELMAKYYGARADAGLIITEGTSPSPNGLGYARIPGLYNEAQRDGWKKVTSAVHAKDGKIFLQVMHTGRTSHLANMPEGAKVLAPSNITQGGQMWTDQQGMQPHSPPKEMDLTDIRNAQQEFVATAKLALEAGFDGIELHAANGYLLEQFLNPNINKRTDSYGGTPEARMRFVLELADMVSKTIGGDKVGIRISPYGVFNETGPFEGIDQFYADLTRKLSELKLAYIHVVDHSAMGAPAVSAELKRIIRKNFGGAYILSGGYNVATAERDLQNGSGDLVAFGRPFLANPDLVDKLQKGKDLLPPDPNTFYTPGPEGYV